MKSTRTRTTKREIGIGYNVEERQARLVSVTKSILKMAEKGEQITVPTLQARSVRIQGRVSDRQRSRDHRCHRRRERQGRYQG